MASTSPVYTSTDDINRVLADVFGSFPTVYAVTDPNDPIRLKTLYLRVISPLIDRSKTFCQASKAGDLTLSTNTTGGVSVAGPFLIRKDGTNRDLLINAISFSTDGSWKPFHMSVFAKKAIRSSAIYVSQPERTVFMSSDAVHEAIIGALVSYLFDIVVAPSLMKYMGLYPCDTKPEVQNGDTVGTMASSQFIFERSDLELLKLLGGDPQLDSNRQLLTVQPRNDEIMGLFNQTTSYDFMIWLTQIAHSIYVMKQYFGIIHGDLHLRNVMLTYVGKKTIVWPNRKPTRMLYDKTDLQNTDFYSYEMPFRVNSVTGIPDLNGVPARIMIQNNGFLPKMIDFGLSSANFGLSLINRDTPLVFTNDIRHIDQFFMGFASLNDLNRFADVDYNFLALNLVFQMRRIVEYSKMTSLNPQEVDRVKAMITGPLGAFLRATIPVEFGLNDTPGTEIFAFRSDKVTRDSMYLFQGLPNPQDWFMRARAVGTTNAVPSVLLRIWSHLIGISKPSFDGKTVLVYLTRDGSVPSTIPKRVVSINVQNKLRFNSLEKYFTYTSALWKGCLMYPNLTQVQIDSIAKEVGLPPGVNSIETICKFIQSKVQVNDPRSKYRIEFFTNILGQSSNIWSAGSLINNITTTQLRNGGFERMVLGANKQIRLFTLRFNPILLNSGKIAFDETFNFNASQRALDFQPPATPGAPMKSVNVHLLYIHENPQGSIDTSIIVEKNDLYNSSAIRLANFSNGVSINGGYFIVSDSELTPGIQNFMFYPIGFSFGMINPQYNGTALPVPKAYQKDFATIFVTDRGLDMMRSTDFLAKHSTQKNMVFYSLNKKEDSPSNYATEVSVIKMVLGSDGVSYPEIIDPSLRYKSAFETGPILIWNGQIILNRQKMEEEMFRIDLLTDAPSKTALFERAPSNILPRVPNFTPYRVVSTAANFKMYFNEPGEANFPYGQRHSNSLMIHNVLCQTYDGKTLIVFVEGRGFDAVGLDRAQLTELVSKFNVKNAVSMDGGFSANAVFKLSNGADPNEIDLFWLLNDPDKRNLSSTIHFGVRDPMVISVV